mmetsp:Transcript_15882/g.24776  ORF Transcript_15882/g.24776 Transcript_15882/m.24776 type:complete len:98 (-) Transcript_15882:71-364(-)|eukprot:CAMPEP_0201517794 /NCGR_PEP_ID=MMETSP0161_2-20130828/8818_1 /ASSEMBLY_ACC=CAM_ASM_000251 /TAXON_ID=180227 /ORGANISM="Neoparamoeba aestuarina, Strain SoJaBio B1-5/56/2" /LENGTH=97 /DNA_ID=CAMNT_0047915407 /DNA_START=79 /DNA_END=372 /DNA_ORIENTATION=+
MATIRAGARESLNTQLEHLQLKYVGTGHADTTKFEWVANQKRDSYASFVGHESMLHYFAVAKNESVGRTRLELLQKMITPCGATQPPQSQFESKMED